MDGSHAVSLTLVEMAVLGALASVFMKGHVLHNELCRRPSSQSQ